MSPFQIGNCECLIRCFQVDTSEGFLTCKGPRISDSIIPGATRCGVGVKWNPYFFDIYLCAGVEKSVDRGIPDRIIESSCKHFSCEVGNKGF